MRRALGFLLLLALLGCQSAGERLPIKPLPEDGQPWPYAELLARARAQSSAANEAFYINRWGDLEEAAKGLEQTARFMVKATEIPERRKDAIMQQAPELGKEAIQLQDAARNQDVNQANAVLQKINLRVRMLRTEN